MANPDHLKILKRGIKKWNQWREAHPDIKPDLSEADLTQADLRRANLSWADLSGAILSEAKLKGADLSEAEFIGANLNRVNLSKEVLIGVNLSMANLSEADLSGADLGDADLSGVDLSEADLSGAKLRGAVLRKAVLRKAVFTGADLISADLTWADLSGADLIRANLTWAHLSEAALRKAVLTGTYLTDALLNKADLRGAYLKRADLRRADLTGAFLGGAILQGTSLQASRLINANLDRANLTGAHLWETQRAGWSIKGLICESVYWDEKRVKLDKYAPGEFERLYSEKVRVQIKYPGGISTSEIVTLPGLVHHLEAFHPGAKLRFESIQDASGGPVVNLVLDDTGDTSPEQIEELRAAIQSEAERGAQQFRLALKEKDDLVLQLQGQVQAYQWLFAERSPQSNPNQLLIIGGIEMGDKYEISGQAGAVGPNAHAHDNTFNQLQQIGKQIEQSMDMAALASELETLRQALKKEAATEEHDLAVVDIGTAKRAAEAKDSRKLAESLKSAGKWALDVATKLGVSLATEAIKQSTGMK